MTLSRIGRISRAFVVSMAVVLGMSACGGYTVGFMWVLGTQYNQIAGYKIADYTGNLTTMVNSPYSSGGSSPVSLAVRVGGNFVYVVNKGTVNSSGGSNHDGNVAVFAVGEDGILTFQESYQTAGNTPVWVAADGTGSFLYVLDAQSPAYGTTTNGVTDLNGDITVFAVDGTTGRLQIVPNQLIKNTAGLQLNYFEVGRAPSMVRFGGSCLYTLDSGDQSIYSYGVGGSGQLTIESNTIYKPSNAINLTSINVSGSSIYLTDAGYPAGTVFPAGAVPPVGSVLPYTAGSGCSLSSTADGAVANLAGTANPVYSFTDSKNKYLYVLNHANPNQNLPNSSISAFVIETTGALVPISDPQNPYPVGSGPLCMVEDPSSQYMYISNSNDGTVTGKFINQNTGQLSDLSRGSTFQAFATSATCLVVSGNVD
jgi:6-phosphogluconolactonase (cycloisomerase 2 family)